jgi:hypothetical protein
MRCADPKHVVCRGKTPFLTEDQARRLIEWISTAGRVNQERRESTSTRSVREPAARSLKGHEGQFLSPKLNARCQLGERTFAGTCGNGRDAPFPAIREAASKSPGSTPKWPLNRFDVVCPKAAIAV